MRREAEKDKEGLRQEMEKQTRQVESMRMQAEKEREGLKQE